MSVSEALSAPMNHILNFRSTNGGGKTALAKAIMRRLTFVKNYKTKNKVFTCVYAVPDTGHPVVFIGQYEGAVTGGVDRVHSVRDVIEAVKEVSEHGHVVMEGLILSGLQTLTKEIADASAEFAEFHAITLDTPLETCVAQTLKRRAAAGNMKPFDPEKSLNSKHHATTLAAAKLKLWGMDSVTCSQQEAYNLSCRYLGLSEGPLQI